MPAQIESYGEIEIVCFPSGASSRSYVPRFDNVGPGDRLAMIFAANEDALPPFALKIVSPSGATILDSIVRDLPTITPQSPPPIELVISAVGEYHIEIKSAQGRKRGEAKVRISR
jgi:hypothetical protein